MAYMFQFEVDQLHDYYFYVFLQPKMCKIQEMKVRNACNILRILQMLFVKLYLQTL